MQTKSIKTIISRIIWSIVFAFVGTVVCGMLLGFTGFVVLTGSSEPHIPTNSLIIDYKKTELKDLKVGDYITWSFGKGYTTHKVVAIKYDGYFQNDELIENVLNDDGTIATFEQVVNKAVNKKAGNEIICNIITQQNSGESASCDIVNYQNDFRGRVWLIFPKFFGEAILYIQSNPIPVVTACAILVIGIMFLKNDSEYDRQF